ncbi:MAG: hypothetical protein IT223_02975 [Crocinitomicaceae bacterium]|nr:hypothetical protein [Crocinitomicaceae bacterium]
MGFLFLLVLASCKKDPGEGGNSSITGKVKKEVRVVLTNPATFQYSTPAADEDVFIVYGDHISPDDRVWTNYKGEYEFLNLRKGKYTVYVYSKDTTGIQGVDPDRMVIKKEIEITDNKQELDIPVLTIYDVP